MMNKLKRVSMLLGITGSMLFGMSCTTQLRDAVTAGALDFVTGTTTDTLSAVVSPDELFGSSGE